MASFRELHRLIVQASKLLNRAAEQIRDLNLDPEVNIHRLGKALAQITEIEFQVYDKRPSLLPSNLKDTKRFRRGK